jgi:hypothetical protein
MYKIETKTKKIGKRKRNNDVESIENDKIRKRIK